MPRCKVCREPTTKRFGLTYLCGVEHAAQYAMAKRDKATAVDRRRAEKKSRSELRAMKIAVRPLKWYADKAREACHEYIRARDGNDPCISCRRHHDGQYHAGHYRPAGVNSSLRYDENNIHRQCAPCNSHLSGNLTNYRIGLIAKIGEEAVVALETSRQVRRWTKKDLIEIRKQFQAKLKQLKAAENDRAQTVSRQGCPE